MTRAHGLRDRRRRYHRYKVERWLPQGLQGGHDPVHAVLRCGHVRTDLTEQTRGVFTAERLECHECPWSAPRQKLADKDPPTSFTRDGLRYEKGCVSGSGEVVELTETEGLIVRTLHAQARPLTRAELLRAVWGYKDGTHTNTAAVHVLNLRRKLQRTFGFPWVVTTWDRRYTLERPQ